MDFDDDVDEWQVGLEVGSAGKWPGPADLVRATERGGKGRTGSQGRVEEAEALDAGAFDAAVLKAGVLNVAACDASRRRGEGASGGSGG